MKKKTLCVIFHRKQKKIPVHSESLKLDSITVDKVQKAKFLGVLLDQHLTWEVHILNVSIKLAKFVPIMYESRQYCTDKGISLIYNCPVYSNLIYCNSIWGCCTKCALQPVKVIQKKIIRGMAGVSLTRTLSNLSIVSVLVSENIYIYICNCNFCK